MLAANKIYNMDCVEGMRLLSADSVDLTVTSPPYDNLRTYNGFSWDFEAVARELYRVTKPGGVVVWVVNDATIKGNETGSSFRQALFFRECGFKLHDTMIWVKDGGGAVGSNKCYTQNFEYMFVFSKGTPKTVNLIKDKVNQSFGVDKSGVGRRRVTGEKRIEKRKPSQPYSKRNNWWYIPPQKGGEHPAVFPEQLAKDHILSWSNAGEIVLDPFSGSGTTAAASKELGRQYIGFEISAEYCAIADVRIEKAKAEQICFEATEGAII